MKKEVLAGAAILLLLVLAAVNVSGVNAVTDQVSGLVRDACDRAADGDWASALACAERAVSVMDRHSTYLHMVLRHDEFDAVYDALEELAGCLQSRDTDAAAAQGRIARTRLASAAQRENVTLGSVF
ncbi:MAG: DUF4363 family protein [Oscillospiraceae bacterium]|jgi:hypothetical protein|nr:DUF4363 family protein [Oscillospiraceae bacterium]